jgi:hypothetical protein
VLDSMLVLAVVGGTTVFCAAVRTAALTRLGHLATRGGRP